MSSYRGQVLMLVNVASKCGFTGQYEGLQKLYETYRDQGFEVLGFPANNFMNQEPGTNEEIQNSCQLNFGVTFPMFAKLSVKGEDQHPLYRYLTSKETNPDHAGGIKWNFTKSLIGRDGAVVARFGSRTEPGGKKVVEAIESALGEEEPGR
jgi:glutathione peroxidase